MAILSAILAVSPIWLIIGILTSKKGSEQRTQLKIALGAVLILLSPVLLYAVATLPLPFYAEPDGPEPQIWKAEFPFTLSYTLNGEPVTVEDTMNCYFGGYMQDLAGDGEQRVWHAFYGSKNTFGLILYKQENVKEYYDGTQWVQGEGTIEGWDEKEQYDMEIRLWVGDPSYYMGDVEKPSEFYPQVSVGVYEPDSYIPRVSQILSGQDIYDSPCLAAYGLQITSLEVADPIKNSFSPPEE